MRSLPRRSLAALVATALASASVFVAAPAAFAADDTTPPVVTINSPVAGAVFDSSTGVSVDFSTSDDVGVASWSVLVNGSGYYSGSDSGRMVVNLFGGRLADGPHTVTVTARDANGNETSESRAFTVDYRTPALRITSPVDGAWVRADGVSIGYSGSDSIAWTVRVDGDAILHDNSGAIGRTFWHATGWADGSTHTIELQADDAGGRTATRSVTVRADAVAPEVEVDPVSATLVPSSQVSGSVSDAGSGVAGVEVSFAHWDGLTCSSTAFTGRAFLGGSASWMLDLPSSARDGAYCVTAKATDMVGNSRTSAPVLATVDVTGPVAPTGLAPDGEFFDAPSTLTWTADADAASYQYRIGLDPDAMDTSAIVDVADASVTLPSLPIGTLYWQVRGIDSVGNVGDWSALAEVTTYGVPELLECASCRLVGGALQAEWYTYPGASAYHLEVTGTDADGDPVVVTHVADASATAAIVALPSSFPTGTITVRMRVELDHEVEGRTFTDWSESINYLRFSEPRQPGLRGPSNGAYIDGDDVTFDWTDDPGVIIWELRLSTSPELDSEGALADTHPDTDMALVDPMFLTILFASSGEVPDGLVLDEVDAEADCAAMRALLELMEVEDPDELPCADGSYTLPSSLPDGKYFWQVRGVGFTSLVAGGTGGPWSSMGQFWVGEAPPPSTPGDDSPRPGARTPVAPMVTGDGDAAVEPADEAAETEPAGNERADDASGSDAGGGADAAAPEADETASDAGEGFPLGLLVGGIVALLVLAGGAVGFFLLRRP